mgnify:CR=1 FL=1
MKVKLVMLAVLASGCINLNPTLFNYETSLFPVVEENEAETRLTFEEGSVTYELEGLRIQVSPMTDQQLNAILPGDSGKGFFSTNPYTYGDWIDPLLGYTPNRFTVFRVTVTNDIYAKVMLDPLKPVLKTDRGQTLNSFGIPSFSPHQSFERYYRAIRGQSGNEFYRFDLRMGNVRSTAYLEDVKVFKGDSYSGFLAFDRLESEVERVELVLRDFVLKFDASEQPIEMTDIVMSFNRRISKTKKISDKRGQPDGEKG